MKEQKRIAVGLAADLAKRSIQPLLSPNSSQLKDLVNNFEGRSHFGEEHIFATILIDKHGNVLAQNYDRALDKQDQETSITQAMKIEHPHIFLVSEDKYEVIAPVEKEGRRLGAVIMGYAIGHYANPVARIWEALFITLIILIAIAVLGSLGFANTITGPIRKLTDAVAKVSSGELDVKVALESQDEIGMLASSFNKMAEDLKNTTVSRDLLVKEAAEREQAERKVARLKQQIEFILGATKTGLDIIDSDFNIRYIDPEWKKVYGDPAGRKCHEYFMDRTEICPDCGIPKALETKEITVTEETLVKEGNRPVQVSTIPFQDEKGEWLVAEVNVDITARKQAEWELRKAHDELELRVKERTAALVRANEELRDEITVRKRMEERLHYLAYYDALTGLPNRSLFLDRVKQGVARAEYNERFLALLFTDIDRFKSINDTFGHDVGDKALKVVAKRLSESTREGDTVARLGNDEFGIAFIDIAAPEDIILIAEEIMKNVSQPIMIEEKEIFLTLSIGISIYPYDGKDTNELMKNADLALANVKKQGMRAYQFHTDEMNLKASEFVLLERNLYKALKNDEFMLYYQPYWEMNTKKIVGMEALIRWKNKDLGLVSPAQFIPVLEETGMIFEVGEWVFKTACRQIKEWQDQGYPVIPVSINVSAVQFRQKNMAEILERIIKEIGVDPTFLALEITESTFMQDVEYTRSVLKKLKDTGVEISIDDFGTGFSSLSYLKRFPVDNLKIDGSFIKDIATDTDTASIVTAIIAMATTLNLETIAEGVETEEQWKSLCLLGCTMGQGYYYSPPLPPQDAKKVICQKLPLSSISHSPSLS
ncbi:MAG: EAL domain-containing protein [Thermodesulfovibrionales bacterium]|nr:EAL domain-containing protein [Thermodesulfovibrionales bacterium]